MLRDVRFDLTRGPREHAARRRNSDAAKELFALVFHQLHDDSISVRKAKRNELSQPRPKPSATNVAPRPRVYTTTS
jgi:hypothetical protein